LTVAWRSLCDDLARLVGPRVVALLEPSHPSHE
jgi:hypothetical protein